MPRSPPNELGGGPFEQLVSADVDIVDRAAGSTPEAARVDDRGTTRASDRPSQAIAEMNQAVEVVALPAESSLKLPPSSASNQASSGASASV